LVAVPDRRRKLLSSDAEGLGLPNCTTFYFGLEVIDDAGNESICLRRAKEASPEL
jgi:hypothetical protein